MFIPYRCEECEYGEYLPQDSCWDSGCGCSATTDEECEQKFEKDERYKSMIEFEKLSELEGASRFGSCNHNKCAANSRNDKSLVRIRFDNTSVTLCERHLFELHDKMIDYMNWKMKG